MPDVNLSYYQAVNQEQREFHASTAKHKLLLGGYGSGKTYPSIHESIFHALKNKGHQYYIFKNTWDFVEELEEDVKRICDDCGLTKGYNKDKHNLTLVNDCVIKFRPLSLGKKKLKGFNMCGFFVDDPDISVHSETISFLFSRLRDTPHVRATRFQSIITANLEGRDWLYLTYMKDKKGDDRQPGGDEKFAYWICPTDHNPTLPVDFISDLEEVHSQEWMDRYVYCKMGSFIGRIYPTFSRDIHHMDAAVMAKRNVFHRTLAVDVGITKPSACLNMFTDGEAIYVPGEFYKNGLTAMQLGLDIVQMRQKDQFQSMVIDPSSAKKEQTSGTSVRKMLWDEYRLNFHAAANEVLPGIQVVKDLLKPVSGPPKIYIDMAKCPNLMQEMEIYRWKEPTNLDTDYMEYKQEPVKKRDHACDALRYGCQQLKKYLIRKHEDVEKALREDRLKRWEERFKKLPMYKNNPALVVNHARKLEGKVSDDLYRRLGYPQLAKSFKRKKKKPLLSGVF